MKVVQINSVYGKGSTGKICLGIAELLKENGMDNRVLYSGAGVDHPLGIKYTHTEKTRWQALKSRVFGNYGFTSVKETKALISELKALSPDIVHIHNIHSHDCHFEMLLSYLKEHQIKTVWTFHDCWCFTGYCPYFDAVQCERWKDGCGDCPQRKNFSWFFDHSKELYHKKKAALDGLDLTIVTPSKWLAGLVKQSFLKNFPVRVIHNGIDLKIFKPVAETTTPIEKKASEKVVLGVAFDWDERKGIDVFVSLAQRLPSDYRIVLVGTDKNTDKLLPDNILSIHRTHDQNELASIYTVADVFVNSTREDNYPTVNMEALACGTPVLTFATGGSPEALDETCGSVVACDDMETLEKEVIRICETTPYAKENCVKYAQRFDQNQRFMEYVELYKGLL